MQDASQGDGDERSRPLTHHAYLAACRRQAQQHGRSDLWVQVRKRYRDETLVLCGQVIELGAGDADWFRVATSDGPVWVQPAGVRLCSGDGRCTCEGACEPAPRRQLTDSAREVVCA